MRQLELRGMERLPRQALQDFVTQANVRPPQAQHLFGPPSVNWIPDHWVSEMREMHPDLMSTPGIQPNFQPGGDP